MILSQALKGKTRKKVIFLRKQPTPKGLSKPLEGLGYEVVRRWRTAVVRELLPILDRELYSSGARETSLTVDRLDDEISSFFTRMAGEGVFFTIQQRAAEWADRVVNWHDRKWLNSVKNATGIEINDLLDVKNAAEIATHQQWAVGLIRDIDAETRKRVEALVFKATTQNTPRARLARDLTRAFGFQRNRARFVARDQTAKLAKKMEQIRHREAGIKKYRWRHSGKVHGRDDHISRDGKIYNWSDPPDGGHYGSEPNCGCTGEAVIEIDGEIF